MQRSVPARLSSYRGSLCTWCHRHSCSLLRSAPSGCSHQRLGTHPQLRLKTWLRIPLAVRVACRALFQSAVYILQFYVTGFTPQNSRRQRQRLQRREILPQGCMLGNLPAQCSAPAVLPHGSPAGSGAPGGFGLLLGFLTGPLSPPPHEIMCFNLHQGVSCARACSSVCASLPSGASGHKFWASGPSVASELRQKSCSPCSSGHTWAHKV